MTCHEALKPDWRDNDGQTGLQDDPNPTIVEPLLNQARRDESS